MNNDNDEIGVCSFCGRPREDVFSIPFTLGGNFISISLCSECLEQMRQSALAKVPVVKELPLEPVLPAVYAWCGYRAGQTN